MRRISLKVTTLLIAYVAWVVLLRVDVGGDLTDTVVTIFGPIPLAIAMLALEDPRGRPIGWLRGVMPGLFPGLVAGSVLGLALRVAMRLVALAAGVPTSFTIPGTLTVLLIFALLGGAYGALLTAAWRSIPGFRSAPGLIGGTALAFWFWYPFFLVPRIFNYYTKSGSPCVSSVRWAKRAIDSRIWSADLVHLNGFGSSLWASR